MKEVDKYSPPDGNPDLDQMAVFLDCEDVGTEPSLSARHAQP